MGSVFQRYSVLAKTMSFLGITGTLQVEDGIVHLVAEKLWEPRAELKPSGTSSRISTRVVRLKTLCVVTTGTTARCKVSRHLKQLDALLGRRTWLS
jgi:hypothetical protein